MWKDQTPRQIFELLKSFKDMNEDSEKKEKDEEKKDYNIKSKNLKIPEWLKDRIPKGANVYHIDDIEKVV